MHNTTTRTDCTAYTNTAKRPAAYLDSLLGILFRVERGCEYLGLLLVLLLPVHLLQIVRQVLVRLSARTGRTRQVCCVRAAFVCPSLCSVCAVCVYGVCMCVYVGVCAYVSVCVCTHGATILSLVVILL